MIPATVFTSRHTDQYGRPEFELWRPCSLNGELIPYYWISSHGRVMSVRNQKIRVPSFDKKGTYSDGRPRGYWQVRLGNRNYRIDHLVLEAFHGPKPSPKHESCHYDDVSSNNRADNVRWDTRERNRRDQLFNLPKPGNEVHRYDARSGEYLNGEKTLTPGECREMLREAGLLS